MEFGSGVLCVEPPVDGGLGGVSLRDQGLDFPSEGLLSGEPLPEAGTGQYAELDFRHVQPTAVFGGVVKLQPLGDAPGFRSRESLVQRRRTVGVQIVQDYPIPPRPPGRLHPPASASGGRSPASCAARSLPPAANPPRAHRPRTGSGYPPSGTRSPAAAAVPAGESAGAGFRPTTGSRSRQSRPLAVPGHRVRRTNPARPPCGPRSPHSPWECTTPASATA